MKTVNGRALLSAYVRDGSEAAFRELVERYINLVYSTAIRLMCGDYHLAEDVAQTVFIDLARKARGLSAQVMLGGWLHRRTCHAAATMLRSERRRRDRERQAMDNQTQDHTQTNLARLAPILDEAINQLNAQDRAAIILRFFEQRDFRSVGQALNTSEDAARMRISRALNKLHSHLARYGVTLGAGALASMLAAEATTAAPAGLAAGIAGTALTSAALGGGISSTLIKLLTMMKMKTAITGALAIATVAALLIAQHQAQRYFALREENRALRDQLEQTQGMGAQASLEEQGDSQQSRDAQREVLRLRGEVGRLRRELQGASAQANGPAQADDRENAPTNVISGFTPLQAAVRSQLALGQSLVVGGWPGHAGDRVFLLAVPQITGDNADQIAVHFAAMEIPESVVADFGLNGIRAGGTWSGASKVLPSNLETFHKSFRDLVVGVPSPDPHVKWIGQPSVTSVNGQSASINCVMASWSDQAIMASIQECKYGENLKVRGSDADIDLGPYNGPTFTVTPIILGDRNTIDLAMQATVFWRFDDPTSN
jgi:RNA polymerase sigma factor (sigma-70 family)